MRVRKKKRDKGASASPWTGPRSNTREDADKEETDAEKRNERPTHNPSRLSVPSSSSRDQARNEAEVKRRGSVNPVLTAMQSIFCPSCPEGKNSLAPQEARSERSIPELQLSGKVPEDCKRFLSWAVQLETEVTKEEEPAAAKSAATSVKKEMKERKSKSRRSKFSKMEG